MGFKLTKCLLLFVLVCGTFYECAFQASSEDGTTDMKKTTRVFSPGPFIADSEQSKAVLSHDPIGSLPNSFTICSTIMAPLMAQEHIYVFFSMLDEDENESSEEESNEIMDYAVAENDTMLGLQSKWSDDDE